jgi:hypothetical protein
MIFRERERERERDRKGYRMCMRKSRDKMFIRGQMYKYIKRKRICA